MRAFTFLAGLILPLALADSAPETKNQPSGVQYVATLPGTSSVSGSVAVSAGPGGNGVTVQVSISGLPSEGGPFLYHVHKSPVDSTGNCSTASGHLDPYNNNGTGCVGTDQAACEVGDLSGKHGNMPGPSFSASYTDLYLAVDDCPSSVINRSIVVHYVNKTAITCANFVVAGGASGLGGGTGSSSSGSGSSGSGAGSSGSGSGGSGSSGAAGSNSGSGAGSNGGGSNGGGPGGAGSPAGSNDGGSNGGAGSSSSPSGAGSNAGGGSGSGGASSNSCA